MGASGIPNPKAEALKDPSWAIEGHPEAQSCHQEAPFSHSNDPFSHSNDPFIHPKAQCGNLEGPNDYPNVLKWP